MTQQSASAETEAIREEHFENKATGVEIEDNDQGPDDFPALDPAQIRVRTMHIHLRQAVDMIEEGDIDLAPDFQRFYAWKDRQKFALIESILLGIPLPTFYFNETDNGIMQVVDGVQRLTTIFNFIRGERFSLGKIDYLKEIEGSTFDQLRPTFRRRMITTQFIVHIIDPQTPYWVKFDIFRRLNTGSSPLNPQEIRHCMSRDRSRMLLTELARSESFTRATGGSLHEHIRMVDREVALRFCAFRIFGTRQYQKSDSLDSFLIRATEFFDDTSKFTDNDRKILIEHFHRAMRNAYTVFGEYAFRKWPLEAERRNPINRALFESWSVTLSDYSEALVLSRAKKLAQAARQLMTEDHDFIDAISQGTGDYSKVRSR
ncbi:MAG: DUF262 domain-containing protein, partial [Myxococcota bacterium]